MVRCLIRGQVAFWNYVMCLGEVGWSGRRREVKVWGRCDTGMDG